VELSETVDEVLARHHVDAAGPVIVNPAVVGGVYIPLTVRRNAEGRQIPAPKVLAEIQSDLRDRGISAEYHLVDETGRVIDEGLRESLIERFPDLISKAVVSIEGGSIQVWIDTTREIDVEQASTIKEHVRKYAELFNVRSFKVDVANEANLPSNLELISLIRRLSPVDCYRLQRELLARQFEVLSPTWINHKLDTMRKAGLVVRMPNRTYALTTEALQRLGTAKGRNSPDVARLLFLARGGR
jgi:hypothetical protein